MNPASAQPWPKTTLRRSLFLDVIPFQRKNRSDVIFEKLQELIGDGQWKPGDRSPRKWN
jgi:hypothetical protein